MEPLAVRRVASRVVKPSSPPPYPFSVLPSSKLDLVIPSVYVKTIYLFKHHEGSRPDFFNSDVLAQALSEALSHFYPLAGSITAHLDIQCHGGGALFEEALASCTIDDLGELEPDPELLKLVPTLHPSHDIATQPLLMVQVTRFECGGAALGVASEHHVADGFSALSFMKAWANIARGEAAFTTCPSFDKAWLKARTPPTPQFIHDEYLKLPKAILSKKGVVDEVVVRMFELPPNLVQGLKHASGGKFSSFELLAAHVWKCCCQARALSLEEESMLVTAVDGRPRLTGAKVPQNYMGNVVFNCCPTLLVGEIMQLSVQAIAAKIRTTIKKMDDAYCKSAIDFLETCSPSQLASFVKGPHTFASPNLGFISWSRLPFYDIDFGWGGATHIGPPYACWDGLAYLLASPPSAPSGSLRLYISLQRHHMQRFAHLLLQC